MRFRRSTLALALALSACGGGEADLPDARGPGLAPEVRPDTPGNTLLFRFAAGDSVETYPSKGGSFLVHFTRAGTNAVPATDKDASGVPDFVEDLADVYDQVLTKYHDELGFRAPVSDEGLADNGGDGRFDIYLVDFAGKGDGNYQNDTCGPQNAQVCAGYMVQENDFAGYGYPSLHVANEILASHEFFHAVQAAYDDGQGSVMAEGSAVWATEQFDSALHDLEGFLPGFFENVDRPLDSPLPGPTDPKSYGSGVFFQFLEERYGAGTVKDLWERCENGHDGVAAPVWITALEPMLSARAQTTFADAFTEFATWNLFTGGHSDPARAYERGSGYTAVKMTDGAAPFSKDPLRLYYASAQYFRVPPAGRAAMTAAVVAHPDTPDDTQGVRVLLAVDHAGTYDAVKTLADPSAGSETVDTTAATTLVVLLVNPAQSGESRKPALCIGSADEVAACRAAVGSGGGGAGGAGAGGGGSGGSGAAPAESGGCGCRTTAPDTAGGSGAILLAAATAFYRRRRKARRASASA